MFKKKTLDNGVRIVYEEIPYLRSVSVGIWVAAGSRYENEFNNGISHFIEHMMFKGTSNRTAKEIAESMESIGGQINAFTGRECTCYYAKALDEHINAMIAVLADIFFNSLFSESVLDIERSVIFEEIGMYEDTPDDLAHDLLSKTVWPGNPLGLPILGSAKCLNNISRDTIIGYMKDNYLPHRTVVSVAGNFKEDSLLEELEKRFGNWKPAKGDKNNIIPTQYKRGFKIKEKSIEQVHVCMGMQGVSHGDDNLYSLLAVNNVFGGTMSSRLFQKVREELGMAYSVFSFPASFIDNGLYTIYAATNPMNLKDVITAIIGEMRKMISEGITPDELARAKEQLKGSFILGLESTGGRMNSIGKSELLLGYIKTPDEILEKIDSITMEQADEIIRTYYKPEEISVAIVGKPAESIEEIKNLVSRI